MFNDNVLIKYMPFADKGYLLKQLSTYLMKLMMTNDVTNIKTN